MLKFRLKLRVFSLYFLAAGLLMGGLAGGFWAGNSFASEAHAQESRISIRSTNLNIPRFVTLKTGLVNMRTGPGTRYPIRWQYKSQFLPVKVITELDVWREVIDHEGISGWMHVSTLSIKRMALVTETIAKIHKSPDADSRVKAVAEKGVLAELILCRSDWCKISTETISGWVRRTAIWGVLEDEDFN